MNNKFGNYVSKIESLSANQSQKESEIDTINIANSLQSKLKQYDF